jgi:antitoxin ParD1/3/4/toxin ParE1/3/4
MAPWVFSPVAESELADILDYIADQTGSRRVAESVLTDFVRAFEQLAATPGIGFRRPQLTGRDVRWWPVHSYLVVYDPQAIPLRVLRVLHGARDLKLLFETDQEG